MSGRIRSIKPEILDDEKAAGLSDRAWRLWVSGWLIADDHGCFRADPRFVRGKVWWAHAELPLDDVEQALLDLSVNGLLQLYVVRGQRYGHVPNWAKHQRVDNAGARRVPGPDEGVPYTSNNAHFDRSAEGLGNTPNASDVRGSEEEHRKRTEEHRNVGGGASSAPADAVAPPPPTKRREEETTAAVARVLETWRRVLYPKANPQPKLTEARRRRVRARLAEGFTVEQLEQAIVGASHDDWLMGREPGARAGGWRDVETVLRDAAQVERLIALVPARPAAPTNEDRPVFTDEEIAANKARTAALLEKYSAPKEQNA